MKLVYLFRHVRPIGILIPNRGVIQPEADPSVYQGEPIPGRPMGGYNYNLEKVHHVDLEPEDVDPLPASLQKNADVDFLREFKLSQAKQIAENIKANEALVRALRSHADAGNIELLGRAKVDHKGNILEMFGLDGQVVPKAETPVKEVALEEEPLETIKVPAKRGPRKKED